MNTRIDLKIYGRKNKIIEKLIRHEIYFSNLRTTDKYIIIKVNYNGLKEAKKIFPKFSIQRYYGKRRYKLILKNNYIALISFLIGLMLLFVLQNIIFGINIETPDKKLASRLTNELAKHNIKRYKFKKSFNEIEKIKKDILKNNKDYLEWLEIEENGAAYNIKVKKRLKTAKKEKKAPRSIIAKKDALITHITAKNGVIERTINDYVLKGEVIINGNVIKGEDEVKDKVHAEGEVFGEVWYVVKITVPFKHKDKIKDKKFNSYYFNVGDKRITLKNLYDTRKYKAETKVVVDKAYLPFKIYKDSVNIPKYKILRLSKKQALDKAVKISQEKISLSLSNDEYIISKKVLKKEYFRSKIGVEVFFKVYENIKDTSEVEEIVKDEEAND